MNIFKVPAVTVPPQSHNYDVGAQQLAQISDYCSVLCDMMTICNLPPHKRGSLQEDGDMVIWKWSTVICLIMISGECWDCFTKRLDTHNISLYNHIDLQWKFWSWLPRITNKLYILFIFVFHLLEHKGLLWLCTFDKKTYILNKCMNKRLDSYTLFYFLIFCIWNLKCMIFIKVEKVLATILSSLTTSSILKISLASVIRADEMGWDYWVSECYQKLLYYCITLNYIP